jgi:hypothetical protein
MILLAALTCSVSGFSSDDMCEPIKDTSCAAWPSQAQMVATVTEIKLLENAACEVTAKPTLWREHQLCPMMLTGDTITFQVCGKCPQVATQTSGVILSDDNGLVILDR